MKIYSSKINNHTKQKDSPWAFILKQEKHQYLYHFRYLFERSYQNILKDSISTYHIISQTNLRKIIFYDLSDTLNNYLKRVLLFEMHLHKSVSNLDNSQCDTYFFKKLKHKYTIFNLFKKYPVLNQRINQSLDMTVCFYRELLTRLYYDQAAICHFFNTRRKPMSLLQCDVLGDRHHAYRAVCKLRLAIGEQSYFIIYKPHDISIDRAFLSFINWFNQHSKIDLKSPKVLLRNGYGWVEHIAYQDCHDKNQFQLFYKRYGILLCLFYVLHGQDINASNLIAQGTYPIVVDLECLCTPVLASADKTEKHLERHLILFTGMLPRYRLVTRQTKGYDASALSHKLGAQHSHYALDLDVDLSTNNRISRHNKIISIESHLPGCQQKKAVPSSYKLEICHGFDMTYQMLLTHKTLLLSEQSPLRVFYNTTCRFLFRNTSVYDKLIHESNHPYLLTRQANLNKHFAWLKQQAHGDLYPHEAAILKQNCIPKYTYRSHDTIIYDTNDSATKIACRESGLTRIYYFLKTIFSQQDLLAQLDLLEKVFFTFYKNTDLKAQCPNLPIYRKIHDPNYETICKRLMDTCLFDQGMPFWITLKKSRQGTFIPSKTNLSLYDGVAGILLALHKMPTAKAFVAHGIDTLLSNLQTITQTCKTPGLNGVLGIIYVINKVFQQDACKEKISEMDISLAIRKKILTKIDMPISPLLSEINLGLLILEQSRLPNLKKLIHLLLEKLDNLLRITYSQISTEDKINLCLLLEKIKPAYPTWFNILQTYIESPVQLIYSHLSNISLNHLSKLLHLPTYNPYKNHILSCYRDRLFAISIEKITKINIQDGLASYLYHFRELYQHQSMTQSVYQDTINRIKQKITQLLQDQSAYLTLPGYFTGFSGTACYLADFFNFTEQCHE